MWQRNVLAFGMFQLAFMVAMGAPGVAPAADPTGPATAAAAPLAKPQANAAEKQIRAALEKPINAEFIDTPLADVILFLKDTSGVAMVLDKKALEDAGVSLDAPITMHVKQLKLRSVLNLALRQLGARWTISDEVLLITSHEAASANMLTRVYDVRDLLGGAGANESPPSVAEFLTTISSSVAPDTWETTGGAGRVQQFGNEAIMIISQSALVHEEIEGLLSQLRETRPGPAAK